MKTRTLLAIFALFVSNACWELPLLSESQQSHSLTNTHGTQFNDYGEISPHIALGDVQSTNITDLINASLLVVKAPTINMEESMLHDFPYTKKIDLQIQADFDFDSTSSKDTNVYMVFTEPHQENVLASQGFQVIEIDRFHVDWENIETQHQIQDLEFSALTFDSKDPILAYIEQIGMNVKHANGLLITTMVTTQDEENFILENYGETARRATVKHINDKPLGNSLPTAFDETIWFTVVIPEDEVQVFEQLNMTFFIIDQLYVAWEAFDIASDVQLNQTNVAFQSLAPVNVKDPRYDAITRGERIQPNGAALVAEYHNADERAYLLNQFPDAIPVTVKHSYDKEPSDQMLNAEGWYLIVATIDEIGTLQADKITFYILEMLVIDWDVFNQQELGSLKLNDPITSDDSYYHQYKPLIKAALKNVSHLIVHVKTTLDEEVSFLDDHFALVIRVESESYPKDPQQEDNNATWYNALIPVEDETLLIDEGFYFYILDRVFVEDIDALIYRIEQDKLTPNTNNPSTR